MLRRLADHVVGQDAVPELDDPIHHRAGYLVPPGLEDRATRFEEPIDDPDRVRDVDRGIDEEETVEFERAVLSVDRRDEAASRPPNE